MGSVKYKPMEPLSCWLEYHLETDKLDPPIFRCRIRPIDIYNFIDDLNAGGEFKMGRATLEAVVDAISEWDLTLDGTPIPLTEENKMSWIRPIIAEPVTGRGGVLLGTAILLDARNRENFLKN